MLPHSTGVRQSPHTQKSALTKRYLVPNIPQDRPQRTTRISNFATGVFRSIRSYDGDTIHVLAAILNEIEANGLRTVEVVIRYKAYEVNYSASVATLRTHGQPVLTDGAQIALARHFWLVDGQAQPQPERMAMPKSKQPEVVQPALFNMPIERNRGAY